MVGRIYRADGGVSNDRADDVLSSANTQGGTNITLPAPAGIQAILSLTNLVVPLGSWVRVDATTILNKTTAGWIGISLSAGGTLNGNWYGGSILTPWQYMYLPAGASGWRLSMSGVFFRSRNDPNTESGASFTLYGQSEGGDGSCYAGGSNAAALLVRISSPDLT